MTTSLENHKIEHIQLDITNTPIQGIGGAPLVLSNNQISFSYDSTDFELDGNSLQIKDSGISHSNLLDLENDDHTQYHNNTRGDVRYYTQTLLDGGQLDSRYYTESESDAVFAPISKGVTNGDSHNHSGGDGAQISHTGLSDLDSNDHSQYLLVADIDDTPVNGETSAPISSNWAYDHVVAADPHTGYRLESADHTHQGSGAQAGQLDHGLALTGLSDDDHTIYALLAGRSGGQTLKGGTDSGDDLTLQSTNHATKGSILFGTSAYDEVNNRLGIGTSTIPHGSVGAAIFALDGANASTAGPHIQITTASDDYPILQQLNWSHDNINLAFDAFYDGAWKSSDVGSNFLFAKNNDTLAWKYDSSIAQGDTISWNTGIVMDSSGNVGIGTTPSYPLDVAGDIRSTNGVCRLGSSSVSTGDCRIELGADRTDNGNSYIDLVGDATYTDYGLRIIRNNSGANANANIINRGTGSLILNAYDAGDIQFYTNNILAIRIDSSQKVGIGAAPATIFDVNGDSIRIRTSRSPASNGTGTQGEIAWDSDYLYVCYATDTWGRIALDKGY